MINLFKNLAVGLISISIVILIVSAMIFFITSVPPIVTIVIAGLLTALSLGATIRAVAD